MDQLKALDSQRGGPQGQSLWCRLNMERVAHRLIQTARMATAEHAMMRLSQAIRRRDGIGQTGDCEAAGGMQGVDRGEGRASA